MAFLHTRTHHTHHTHTHTHHTHTVAVERLNQITSSPTAWQPSYSSMADADDTKVPECTEGLMSLIAGITGRGGRVEAERRREKEGEGGGIWIIIIVDIFFYLFLLPTSLPTFLRPLQAAGQCPSPAQVPRAAVGPHARVPPGPL